MAKTATITVRVEPTLKAQVEELYRRRGMTVSNAISMFLHQSLMVDDLPFVVGSHDENKSQ